MSSLHPHRQSSSLGFYGFVCLLILAAILSQKARATAADTGRDAHFIGQEADAPLSVQNVLHIPYLKDTTSGRPV